MFCVRGGEFEKQSLKKPFTYLALHKLSFYLCINVLVQQYTLCCAVLVICGVCHGFQRSKQAKSVAMQPIAARDLNVKDKETFDVGCIVTVAHETVTL